jgi:hypothetical protein
MFLNVCVCMCVCVYACVCVCVCVCVWVHKDGTSVVDVDSLMLVAFGQVETPVSNQPGNSLRLKHGRKGTNKTPNMF